MVQKTISHFLSNEYREFAMYVLEGRAIPSVIDGFKPTQRKVIHIASQVWKSGNEKSLKVFQLSGKVASDAFYHHGDMSLSDAIINMAQRFKNNSPLLEDLGQYGSLRSPKAGAARYIETKLSDNFHLLYKDFELLTYKEEEGERIEPEFFLPIIPTILLNGGSGIAVGFASNILNRDPKELIDACIKVLNDKPVPELKPKSKLFNGTYTFDKENNRWVIRGLFTRANTTTVKISELPPSVTYQSYEAHLDKLTEDKKIVTYDDSCKDNIDYSVKFTRSDLEKLDDTKLIKMLKLEEYETENLTTLDENGKLKIFTRVEDIVTYFVNFRLGFYTKRKEFLLNKMQHELVVLSNRGRFIKAILDGKIKVNNVAKAEIITQIIDFKLEEIDGNYDYLLRMAIYSLTKEMFEKLKEDFKLKKEEIDNLKVITPKDMYLSDLSELKKNFK